MTAITNISVVDDDVDILSIIDIEFKNDPEYKFKFFQAGVELLSHLDDDLDLAIIDVHMPDFDVIRAVETIDEVSPMAYIIIISAEKDFMQLVNLTNMGIFRFCVKDGENFLPELRKYIRAAHWKISKRKHLIAKFQKGHSTEEQNG